MKNKKQIAKFCKEHNLTEDQFLGTEPVSGSLYLSSLTSIPEGFNPTKVDTKHQCCYHYKYSYEALKPLFCQYFVSG